MYNDDFISPCANTQLINQELEELIYCIGSLVTIITNKPISCVTLFLIIQKSPALKNSLVEMSDTTWFSIVEYMAHRYPSLNKSKKIKK